LLLLFYWYLNYIRRDTWRKDVQLRPTTKWITQCSAVFAYRNEINNNSLSAKRCIIWYMIIVSSQCVQKLT